MLEVMVFDAMMISPGATLLGEPSYAIDAKKILMNHDQPPRRDFLRYVARFLSGEEPTEDQLLGAQVADVSPERVRRVGRHGPCLCLSR